MRNNKTRYWTDGPGIGRKLKGGALERELKRLADIAHEHDAEANKLAIGMLEHARIAGDALLQAERRLGGRKKWSQWRRNNITFCKETSCHYMRIARHWNDSILVEARRSGANSINALLKVLREARKVEDATKQPSRRELQNMELDLLRQELRKSFGEKLKKLDESELGILTDQFDNRTWPIIYDDLQETAHEKSGTEYHDEQFLDNEKKDIRRQIHEALNRKRDTSKISAIQPQRVVAYHKPLSRINRSIERYENKRLMDWLVPMVIIRQTPVA